MIPEYTVWTVIGMLVVIGLELFVIRSGIFRRAQYWAALAICLGFQCLVDGWLTKLSDPIVIYNPDMFLGIRFPFDIPIEDFGFGFAMITAVLMLWQRNLNRRPEEAP
ncbi:MULTISPECIES: lycopene cyclase domain-containing protein [unclassified Brevibacterium]|uniref:lycopene cyclase domain-containing protein n=1 Tax=unclassified Brevibacterium TaxID=2614124 RepID=UPI0010931C48|nr:lycopene cyclase domain-containing protein [Brevibacterium sp. S22]TGD29711.1 lycopene cyclase domain-containing protein [Brevibacterium sp. S22]